MSQTPDSSSPIPAAKRETVSKYPRLESGFPVASLDPTPIQKRDAEIDMIWKSSLPHLKQYLNDVLTKFDSADIQFNRAAASHGLNTVREAVLKRLAYDGITTGRISMPQTQQHYSLELVIPGYQQTPTVLRNEIFSLIAVKRPPSHPAAQQKPA
jgi:hypothetical protein